jgi:hypothetical protein
LTRPDLAGRAVPAIAAVLLAAVAYLAVLLPWVVRSQPSDDTLLLVPTFLARVASQSLGEALVSLVAPNQPHVPRATWKAYVLLAQALAGPSHAALVGLGVLLHVGCSLLVWRLARRLGLDPSAAWIASGLHLTAYPGFHAYLWPVGVQHVVTVGGVLAVMDLYLAADRRARDGQPSRGLYWATVAVALVASLSRATSAVGPVAVLAHAVLGPGDPRQRLARYDGWRVPMFLALVYPLALTAYGNDLESLGGVPPAAEAIRLLVWRVSPAAAFGCLLAVTFGILLLVRVLLARSGGDAPSSPRRRLAPRLAGAVVALPLVPKLALVAIWGTGLFLAPLGSALLSHNADRWHVAPPPLDLVVVIATSLVGAFFARAQWGNRDLLVLLAPAALFALALHATEPQPIRYWIYLTPVLAVVLAGAASAAAGAVAASFSRSARWAALALALAAGIVMVTNVVAIRLQIWRHILADSFLVLDYVRAADLIRHDLAALGMGRDARVCVDGLTRMPHEEGWMTIFAPGVPLGALNARIVLARGLGRTPGTVQVGCPADTDPATHRYRVDGTAIVRDGRSIDTFERGHAALRDLVAAGDYTAAGALVRATPGARPFTIRHLLGELPDADAAWLTNGASILVWLARTADNHDHWHGRADDKVAKLHALAAREIGDYTRFQILAEYVRRRSAPDGEPLRPGPLPFGGIPLADVKALLDADPVLRDLPDLSIGLEGLGDPRTTPDVPFLAFLGRLLLAGDGAGSGTGERPR